MAAPVLTGHLSLHYVNNSLVHVAGALVASYLRVVGKSLL